MHDERRRVSLSDHTPQPVWNYALPDGWSYNGNPVFYNGTVVISAVNNATTTVGLWAIDAQTQDTRWSHSQADVLFGTPVVADGIVYVSDNGGNIWAFAADSTGQMQWRRSY
jgi:outer membrane protein assembly factor BamB